MYSVLVVDDEIRQREAVIKSVNWEKAGFKVVGVLRSLSLHLFSAAMKKSSSAPKWVVEILSLHRVEDLLTEEHPSIQYKWKWH